MALVMFCFAGIAARVVQLQAIDPERYVSLSQQQTTQTQLIAAHRGSIFDRNGNELALTVPLSTVYTDPKFVTDAQGAADALAPILEVERDDLLERLVAENRFGYLARQVSDEVAAKVEELDLDGVYLIEEPHRFSSPGGLASSIIGLTDIDNVGLSGIELQYDSLLAGRPGRLTIERDPEGRTIAAGARELTPAVPGDGLVLTIDQALQYEAERVMKEQVQEHRAEAAVAVISDPRTGEILAMANVEADPDSGDPIVSSNNLALTTVYEPGSVMKIVGMSGALEDGVVTPDTWVQVPDTIQVGGETFSEYEPHGPVSWPLEDVIVHSSNVGSIQIAQMLGAERLHHYFSAFGFGQPTGLDFPNEQSGYLRPVEEWWGSSIGSMPIGQGISVTPLQMLMAYNTIANGGEYVPPRLVLATVGADGDRRELAAPAPRRVLSEETAQIVRQMLTEVVTRGTAQSAQVDGYYPAGKTGTAQIPTAEGGYIWPDGTKHYMATFVGFLPANDPQLSMIVITRHPRAGAYTGGTVSGPAWARLARFAVEQLHIPRSDLQLDPADLGSAQPPSVASSYNLGEPPAGRVRAQPATVSSTESTTAQAPVTG